MHSKLLEVIAEEAHEANKAWCEKNGDYSQKPWNEAPEWQKESVINGVKFILENPMASVSANHDNWLKVKQEAGWVYGEVKDPNANPPTHPCVVPFNELSEIDQQKNIIFKTVVLDMIGNDAKNHKPLPVAGYTEQNSVKVNIVNGNKHLEENVLRLLDGLGNIDFIDQRWLDIGRTHIEQGFMAINRSVFKPERVDISNQDPNNAGN